MPPKKPNAFMTFMFEWKENYAPNMSIAQATTNAGIVWSKMSAKEREPYNVALKPKRAKLTSLGTPIDLITREHKEKERSQERMVKTIERTLKLALDGKRLENEKFYFIYVNYFVKMMHSDLYVPAEIAVVEFSLKEGVSRKYHTFINPNVDFFGNAYETLQHSETTHKLPVPPNAIGESDMSKISEEILNFILDKNVEVWPPPLYTLGGTMDVVSSVLLFLSEHCDTEDHDISKIKIYSIQELFYALKCATCELNGNEKPRNRFVSDTILDKDVFEYCRNIACEYHEEIDRSNYCALSHVYRWGFTFVDYMANGLPIRLLPGYHMPDNVNTSEAVKEFNTVAIKSTSRAMFELSLEPKYESCNDTETDIDKNHTGVSSSQFFTDTLASVKPDTLNTTKQDYCSIIESVYSTNNMNCNPWQRLDESKPPDDRFLSIDFDEPADTTQSSVKSRRLGRGRGIIILEEFK